MKLQDLDYLVNATQTVKNIQIVHASSKRRISVNATEKMKSEINRNNPKEMRFTITTAF